MRRKRKVVEMSPEEKEFKDWLLRQMKDKEEKYKRQKEREEKWKRYLMVRKTLITYLDQEVYESIFEIKTNEEEGAE